MEIGNWVQSKFGSTETGTLLDEEVYSTRSLRKDKKKLERKLSDLESQLSEHETRYKHFLHKGAEANDIKKQQLAQKARFEKKKYQVSKKKYKQVSLKLGTVISIKGMREITSMQSQQELDLDTHIDPDLDTSELQNQVLEEMSTFGLELEDMKEVQEALDVEILGDDIETEASEEMELMEEMEAGSISEDQITLDDTNSTEDATTVSDDEFDIEADIEDDKLDLDSL